MRGWGSTSSARAIRKTALRAYCGCAAVFLIYGRSAHGTACSKNHASMIFSPTLFHGWLGSSTSSARAIRKTALSHAVPWLAVPVHRAIRKTALTPRLRRCFPHKQALSSWNSLLEKSYEHDFLSHAVPWLNWWRINLISWLTNGIYMI